MSATPMPDGGSSSDSAHPGEGDAEPRLGPSTSPADLVEFFDSITIRGVGLRALLEQTAEYIGGSVGLSIAGVSYEIGDPDGDTATQRPVVRHDRLDCWIRSNHLLSGMVIHRLGVAVQVLGREAFRRADAEAPLRLILRNTRNHPAVAEALEQLETPRETPVRLLWIHGSDRSAHRELARDLIGRNHVVAMIDNSDTTVLAISAAVGDGGVAFQDIPKGLRTAQSRVAPICDASELLGNLRAAARFSLPSRGKGPYEVSDAVFFGGDNLDLGSYELLCELDAGRIARNPAVRVIAELVDSEGAEVLRVLEVFSVTSSFRQASSILYMHHNTVAYWVHRAEQLLGYSADAPYGRNYLFVALCMYRLSTTGAIDVEIP